MTEHVGHALRRSICTRLRQAHEVMYKTVLHQPDSATCIACRSPDILTINKSGTQHNPAGDVQCSSRTSFAIVDTPGTSQVTDQCSGHGVPSGVPDNGWDGSVMEWVSVGQSIYPGNRTSTVPLAQHCANAVEPSQKPGPRTDSILQAAHHSSPARLRK